MIQVLKGAADAHKDNNIKNFKNTASQKWEAVLVFMETVEDKKKYKLPKYITTKELEELMNSDEMKKLVRQLEMIEEYKQKTQDISIGEY